MARTLNDIAQTLDYDAARRALWNCTTEPPPPGPTTETEEEFQRRVDALLAYKTPVWRDAAALFFIAGTLCLAASAVLWLMAD